VEKNDIGLGIVAHYGQLLATTRIPKSAAQ
jgi:hypothetical protein